MIPLRDNVPTRTVPFVTYAILGLNVAVFVLELIAPASQPLRVALGDGRFHVLYSGFDQFVWTWGLRPAELLDPTLALAPATPVPEWATLVTSMFMHGGWMHIIGNMLYLWIFADNVEDAMGHVKFAVFYLLAGGAAAAAQIVSDPASPVPMVGASGAIAGVLGAYLILHPKAQVLTLVPIFFIIRIVQIPALILLGFWFLLQLLQAPAGGGTAWFAHIGGFVFGLGAVWLFAAPRRGRQVARG